MKILAIGNSFSEDATYYFEKICSSAGESVKVVNLYIGGCTLERHALNIKENNREYRYELNGRHTERFASIEEVLAEEKWDIVTVQQQSGNAGVYESYGENIKTVLKSIKKNAPTAKIYFHQTWAYELDSKHGDFVKFENSQEKMFTAIVETVHRVCKENGALQIIPCGEIIQSVRANPIFDYENGGQSLCRDGFHMHLVYGRYLLGLVWFAVLLKGDVDKVSFVPSKQDIINGHSLENFSCDNEKIGIIKRYVKEYFTS